MGVFFVAKIAARSSIVRNLLVYLEMKNDLLPVGFVAFTAYSFTLEWRRKRCLDVLLWTDPPSPPPTQDPPPSPPLMRGFVWESAFAVKAEKISLSLS